MADSFFVGCDLGQSRDPTAIAIVRKAGDNFQVGHLERLPLGTPYPGVVRHVSSIMDRLPRGVMLAIDYTGVGKPVFDIFELRGVTPIGVTIMAGQEVVKNGKIYSVPKLVLVTQVQALLHAGRLTIQKCLPEVPALIGELQDFRAEVTDSGYWRFGARAGKHDDLVLALAIALWDIQGLRWSGFGSPRHGCASSYGSSHVDPMAVDLYALTNPWGRQ